LQHRRSQLYDPNGMKTRVALTINIKTVKALVVVALIVGLVLR
jgi:hypothetical protein